MIYQTGYWARSAAEGVVGHAKVARRCPKVQFDEPLRGDFVTPRSRRHNSCQGERIACESFLTTRRGKAVKTASFDEDGT